MRTRFGGFWVGAALLFLCGCNLFNWNQKKQPYGDAPAEKPTPQELVTYLNRNATQVRSINVQDLNLEIHHGLFSVPAVNGRLVCEKSRNFRMEVYAPGGLGSLEADVGSNDQEFWFYVARGTPRGTPPTLFHCNHSDVGRVTLPFPFHPDWILEALGMNVIQDTQNFHVKMEPRDNTIELVEATYAPQGEPIYKVTVFNRRTVSAMSEPQVVSRKLVNRKGDVICSAYLTEMQQDRTTGIVVPRRIEFDYPQERLKLRMVLDTVTVNGPVPAALAQTVFQRPSYPGVQQFDLARRAVDTYRPQDVRPTAGTFRGFRQ